MSQKHEKDLPDLKNIHAFTCLLHLHANAASSAEAVKHLLGWISWVCLNKTSFGHAAFYSKEYLTPQLFPYLAIKLWFIYFYQMYLRTNAGWGMNLDLNANVTCYLCLRRVVFLLWKAAGLRQHEWTTAQQNTEFSLSRDRRLLPLQKSEDLIPLTM